MKIINIVKKAISFAAPIASKPPVKNVLHISVIGLYLVGSLLVFKLIAAPFYSGLFKKGAAQVRAEKPNQKAEKKTTTASFQWPKDIQPPVYNHTPYDTQYNNSNAERLRLEAEFRAREDARRAQQKFRSQLPWYAR